MKGTYFLLTAPFYFFAVMFRSFNLFGIRGDIQKCRLALKHDYKYKLEDDDILKILSIAEDHRVYVHFGIDQYAMVRAIYYTNVKKEFQGASTIAQQLVRVITQRYEKNIVRKFREQLLAVLISKEYTWEEIASTYMNIAFLGSGMNGLDEYLVRKKLLISKLTFEDKLQLISCLKYPEPIKNKEKWYFLIKKRMNSIQVKLNDDKYNFYNHTLK